MALPGLGASEGLSAAVAAPSSLHVSPGTSQWSQNMSFRTGGVD